MEKLIRVIIVFLIIISPVYKIKAEVIIEIKIPDEIKCCKCGCGENKENKEETPKSSVYTPLNPRYTTDIDALQKIAIAEAGNTDVYTMACVMQTVLNRVESDEFPNTVEEVISQKGQFATYPDKYNKAKPNELSQAALNLLSELNNQDQLYFENTVAGSWQSTNLQWVFNSNVLSFYK